MAPLIGLNIDINVKNPNEARIARRYYESAQSAGGTAVLMPPMSTPKLRGLLPKLHGVILIGGRDYATSLYGGDTSAPHNPLDPARQDFDLRLGRMLLRQGKIPVLAICGGMQLVNILCGGPLVEHIPNWAEHMRALHPDWQAVAHQKEDGSKTTHPVDLIRGTKVAAAYRRLYLPQTVSSHHQGVIKVGRRLIVSATAADGIVEAIELPGKRFFVCVQWHPEYEHNSPIMRALVKQARIYAGL